MNVRDSHDRSLWLAGEPEQFPQWNALPGASRSRVAFYTLGCKVNQAETDAMAEAFRFANFECVPFEDAADVYIVNTCTVTHVADAKSRQILRQAKRLNPNALVVATGCYASIARDRLPIEDVLVVRNRDKERLLPLVQQRLDPTCETMPVGSEKPMFQGLRPRSSTSRTRAMVKAQDGCDSVCSYCIIPRARGRSRSVPPEGVMSRVARLVEEGHKEIVLTGVDLGSYGEDQTDYPDLGGLIRSLLMGTEVQRIRISSLEPGDFKNQWLELWQSDRLCRHLHVPLQAGSDAVLRRMRRRYGPRDFFNMIEACRASIPGVSITTDVMAGFPGETDGEFEEGMRFIESCGFDGMHVFPYSVRPGTAAAHLPDHVGEPVKKERSARLRQVAETGRQAHLERNRGAQVDVVWETHTDGVWRGLSDTNIQVFACDRDLRSDSVDRRTLTLRYRDGLWGEPITEGADRDRVILPALSIE